MKKTFTILIAAIAAILMMTLPEKVVGQTTTTYQFNSKSWGTTTTNWTSKKDGNAMTDGQGIQVTTGASGACGNSDISYSNVSKITVTYCTNNKAGNGSISWYNVSSTTATAQSGTLVGSQTITAPSSGGTTLKSFDIEPSSSQTGFIQLYVTCTTNSVYVYSVKITYSSGPTQLSAPTNFSATAGNAQATFSWTAVDHASNYTILAKNGETWDNPTVLFDNVSLTNGQYVGTGLTNGTTYVCKVRANGDGTNYSNSVLSETTATFTPTAAQQYTVSIAEGITGGTVGANPTTATAGTTIQVTANATAGYYLTALSYTDGQTSTNIDLQSLQFTMPSSNVTINATFTPFTVTLNACGGTIGGNSTATWHVGDNSGNLPAATPPCNTWTFYGWKTTSALNEQTTTAPTCVNGTGYVPAADITLYAVYKKTVGGSTFDISNGGDYMIYATTNGENPTNYYATGNVTNNALSSTTNISEASTYTFEKLETAGQFSIKYSSSYIASTSGSADLSSSNSACTWAISAGSNDTWSVKIPSSTRDLIFRTTGVFKNYSSGNTNNSSEYFNVKIGTPSTTYYHSTPDCTETVATPTFDPDGGNFETTQTVHISCDTPEVSIFYTLNGVEPTNEASETNFAYNAQTGVSIATTTTLKAKAFKEGWYASATKSATYTIQHDVAEPTLPASQVFTTNIYSVEITVPANTTVYYTTNGDNPTNASTPYSAAFTIDATKTVKAIAYDGDGCASDVVSATYTRAYSLAAAKALYTNANVPNITINLVGVQFVAKSGSNTYVQQGEVGLMIYGSHSQDLTNGDVFTAGTVTGTITKYGQNMELSISTGAFVGVAKEAGTLAASATGVTIPNITGSFSTYEDRFVSLTSLTMSVSGKTLTDTDSHTLAIYDPFSVLSEAVQPNHNVVVTGVVTSYYSSGNITYQIIPLDLADITTGVAATLPALNPAGGATSGEAVETETVQITPAANTTVDYVFGEASATGITAQTDVTVPSTTATALELTVNRDFYTKNTATYYYKTSATTYDVKFYVNGDEDTSLAKEVVEGGALGALPTPTTPSGYTFRGWAQAEISGVQNNAPTMVSSTTTVNADMDLYAVFAIQTNIEETIELTNSAITNYKSNNTTSYSNDYSINNWTGRYLVNNSGNTYYLQLGYNASTTASAYNSHLTTPSCANNITSITISTNKGTSSGRTFYLCSASNLGTASSTNATYGSGSTTADDGSVTINVSGNTKQFHIYPNGTAYIESVTLVCSAVTYSDYCTTVSVPSLPLDEGKLTEDYTIPTGTAYTLTSPVTVPSGKTLIVPANAVFANAVPANLIIEDGGQLITSSTGVKATIEKYVDQATNGTTTNWYLISSPVGTVSTDVVEVNDINLYAYNEANLAWNGYESTSYGFENLVSGKGYLYRNSEETTLSFTGEVVTGTVSGISLSCERDDDFAGFNLLGNPYSRKITSSCISLSDEASFTGVYTLDTDGNWHSAVSTDINPCEGFLVQVDKAATATFGTPAKGTTYNNDYIQFTVANSQYEDVTYALFRKGNGLSKINHRNAEIPMLYINQNDRDYAIANFSDNTKSFSLNFKAMTTGKYTLSYNTTGEYNYLHVIDRLTGADVDMLLEGEYSFIATPSDNTNRFIVRLEYIPNYSEGNAEIFAFQNGNEILVSGSGELQIFDVTGRSVMTTTINGAESINIPTQGVYIFRLVGNEVKTQKIVVR